MLVQQPSCVTTAPFQILNQFAIHAHLQVTQQAGNILLCALWGSPLIDGQDRARLKVNCQSATWRTALTLALRTDTLALGALRVRNTRPAVRGLHETCRFIFCGSHTNLILTAACDPPLIAPNICHLIQIIRNNLGHEPLRLRVVCDRQLATSDIRQQRQNNGARFQFC